MNTVESHPFVKLSGRTMVALVLAPELPLAEWLSALDAQIDRSPSFFEGRPVMVNLVALPREQPNVAELLRDLERRGIRIIGTEGAHPSWEGIEAWGRPLPSPGKAGRPIEPPDERASSDTGGDVRSDPGEDARVDAGDATATGRAQFACHRPAGPLRPVRRVRTRRRHRVGIGRLRGRGDGGRLRPYLRHAAGRAIAGLFGNSKARVFCRKLEAELVAIDGVYQTADDMPGALIGKPVQAWLDGEQMKMTALD